jgi:hypothetical protein
MLPVGMLVTLLVLGGGGPALANGDTQREVQGRVVSVDPQTGTVMIDRVFRGRTARVALQIVPGTKAFTCGDEPAPSLDRLQVGSRVSVFYEVLGAEGVANLVVVEPVP